MKRTIHSFLFLNFFFTFFLILPSAQSQQLVHCNDSTSYFLTTFNDFHCSIKLIGKIDATENSRVIAFHNYALQTLILKKEDYTSNGVDDIAILTNFILKETQSFTANFQEKLNLALIPVEITKEKKSVLWHFEIPDKIQKKVQEGLSPATTQVFVSRVLDDYIFTIATTLFKDQSLDDLQKILSDLIRNVDCKNGYVDTQSLCK